MRLLAPGGASQPGYFHPRDAAADAPESAWFATTNDARCSNDVASHPPTALNNIDWLSAWFTDRMHTKWRVFCSVRKPLVFLPKTC